MGYQCLDDIGSGAQMASITYTIVYDHTNQRINDAESESGVHNFVVNGDNHND